jgi:hypothetical protein
VSKAAVGSPRGRAHPRSRQSDAPVPEAERAALLRELVALDMAYRRKAGEDLAAAPAAQAADPRMQVTGGLPDPAHKTRG